jgi:hypothetical protein
MGLARSPYYDASSLKADDAKTIASRLMAIARLALSFAIEGSLVNSKKVRRLMRKHDRKQAA